MHERARQLNSAGLRTGGDYVLYWSQMNRRADANQALDFAIELANELALPVLYYEGLTCTYPYASDRFHTLHPGRRAGNAAAPGSARASDILSICAARPSDPNDVFYRLAARAAAVVTDDYPTFIAARHNASVAPKLDVAFYAVDASCIVPMACFEKREYAAYTIRPEDPQTAARRILWPLAAGEGRQAISRREFRVPHERHRTTTSPRWWHAARSITPCVLRSRSRAGGAAAEEQARAFS